MKTYIINVRCKATPKSRNTYKAIKNKEVENMEKTIINLFVLLSRTNYEIIITKRLINSKELETPRGLNKRLETLLKLREHLKEILGIPKIEKEIKQVP